MYLGSKAFTGAAHLIGIVSLLRQIYPPRFELDGPIQAALDAVACIERSPPRPVVRATAS